MRLGKTGHAAKGLSLIVLGLLGTSSFADPGTERIERLEATVSALQARIAALEKSSVQSERNVPNPKASGDWKNKSNWRLLNKGMSKDEVREILGEPERIRASGSREEWDWEYPVGPSVEFRDDEVYGWNED